jgi:hypothetical protein
MSREPLFSSAAAPQGVMSAVKDYWANYPDAMARALRPEPRASAAQEVYRHLPASPIRTGPSSSGVATSSARVAHSPARAGAFLARGSAPPSSLRARSGADGPHPVSMSGGGFFSDAEAARGCVSPLGNRVW